MEILLNIQNRSLNVLFRHLHRGEGLHLQSLLTFNQSAHTRSKRLGVFITAGLLFGSRQQSGRCAMPKKEKTGKDAQRQSETVSGPVTRDKSGRICIAVHAKPGSKQNAITDVSPQTVGVAIAAPPTDGEANAELLWYLSKVLELKKSEITLDRGCKSREKLIKVTGSVSLEEVLERLKKAVAE
ncbi:hypothetical protein GJAV_G00233470 [Gymnothorax javanicus]|nr:hypothetical protein GJAV_G00233470 [Gymnothorax javanicus]